MYNYIYIHFELAATIATNVFHWRLRLRVNNRQVNLIYRQIIHRNPQIPKRCCPWVTPCYPHIFGLTAIRL